MNYTKPGTGAIKAITFDVTVGNVTANLTPGAYDFTESGSAILPPSSSSTVMEALWLNPGGQSIVSGSSSAVTAQQTLTSGGSSLNTLYEGVNYGDKTVSFTDQIVIDPSKTSTFSINDAVTGVPEASTWVMMLAGFVGLGFAGVRRNTKARILA